MSDLDLAAIRERYTLALNAKPSKGPYSEKGITALTDSVCDVPELMAKIDRLQATIQRVREIERRMDEYAHRSGPCTGVNCGGCQAGRFSTALRRAIEGGEAS